MPPGRVLDVVCLPLSSMRCGSCFRPGRLLDPTGLRHSTRVWLLVMTTNAMALSFMTVCVSFSQWSMMDGFPPEDHWARRGIQFVANHLLVAQLISPYPVTQFVPIDSGHHATGLGSGCCLSFLTFNAQLRLVQARKTVRSHKNSASLRKDLVARHDNRCNCIEFHDHVLF